MQVRRSNLQHVTPGLHLQAELMGAPARRISLAAHPTPPTPLPTPMHTIALMLGSADGRPGRHTYTHTHTHPPTRTHAHTTHLQAKPVLEAARQRRRTREAGALQKVGRHEVVHRLRRLHDLAGQVPAGVCVCARMCVSDAQRGAKSRGIPPARSRLCVW